MAPVSCNCVAISVHGMHFDLVVVSAELLPDDCVDPCLSEFVFNENG